eukprot:Hpha_TRINITY_DN15726_c1_g3::TRINITY_DN15726_c1_g3_i1::g.40243::m.40243
MSSPPEGTDHLQTAIDAIDKLADESSGVALIASLVWVFALDWANGYETDAFQNGHTNEYETTLHGAFVVFIGICVGAGGFGVILLSLYYNVMKLISFQATKTGELTHQKVMEAYGMVDTCDVVTQVGRVFSVAIAFPAFMVAATIYFWAKNRHNMGMSWNGAKEQGIFVVSLITLFLIGSLGASAGILHRYGKFKKRASGDMPEGWWANWFKAGAEEDMQK